MGIIGDVFGLSSIYERQVQNVDNNNFESWPESAAYGYTNKECVIQRLDFSTETLSNPGNETSVFREFGYNVSNSSYGYFCGSESENTIDRLDFSNETVSQPGNNFPATRNRGASLQTPSYGYFVAGEGAGIYTSLSRLSFSDETLNETPAVTPPGSTRISGVQNDTYGYFNEGGNPAISCAIYRLDFSTENATALSSPLPTSLEGRPGTFSSSLYGYFVGGYNAPGTTGHESKIQRLDFSNESNSIIGNLQVGASDIIGASNNLYGYTFGGSIPPLGTFTSNISRLDLVTETLVPQITTLPTAESRLSAVSGGQSQRPKGSRTYGYFVAGSSRSLVERLDFSSDTFSDPGNVLPENRRDFAATSNSSYGYFAGGDATPPFSSTIERFDFSNETASRPDVVLSEARREFAATSSNSYGYFAGGDDEGLNRVCTIDRLDFFSETIASPGNYQLLTNRNEVAATSSSSYGYFAGGNTPGPVTCTIDRLDFSNETVSRPNNDLPQEKYRTAEVSNNLYAYFGGGTGTTDSTILRLDFSNETTNRVLGDGGVLDQARQRLAAVSSSSYGYFAGGNSPGASAVVDSFDFSNEVAARAANDLPASRTRLNAVFN